MLLAGARRSKTSNKISKMKIDDAPANGPWMMGNLLHFSKRREIHAFKFAANFQFLIVTSQLIQEQACTIVTKTRNYEYILETYEYIRVTYE